MSQSKAEPPFRANARNRGEPEANSRKMSLIAVLARSISAASRDSKEPVKVGGFGRFFAEVENANADRLVAFAMFESTAPELEDGRNETDELAPTGHGPTGQFDGKTGATREVEEEAALTLEDETTKVDQPSTNVHACSQKGTRMLGESPGFDRP